MSHQGRQLDAAGGSSGARRLHRFLRGGHDLGGDLGSRDHRPVGESVDGVLVDVGDRDLGADCFCEVDRVVGARCRRVFAEVGRNQDAFGEGSCSSSLQGALPHEDADAQMQRESQRARQDDADGRKRCGESPYGPTVEAIAEPQREPAHHVDSGTMMPTTFRWSSATTGTSTRPSEAMSATARSQRSLPRAARGRAVTSRRSPPGRALHHAAGPSATPSRWVVPRRRRRERTERCERPCAVRAATLGSIRAWCPHGRRRRCCA